MTFAGRETGTDAALPRVPPHAPQARPASSPTNPLIPNEHAYRTWALKEGGVRGATMRPRDVDRELELLRDAAEAGLDLSKATPQDMKRLATGLPRFGRAGRKRATGTLTALRRFYSWRDFQEYRLWYLTEGSAMGRPLESTTLYEDMLVLSRLAFSGIDLFNLTVPKAKLHLVDLKKAGGHVVGTLNNQSKVLSRFLRWRTGTSVELPTWTPDDWKNKALNDDQIHAINGYRHGVYATQVRNLFLFNFAIAAGPDPEEASWIDVDDFDLELGGVHIRHPCKGHRAGFVPMKPSILTAPNRPSWTVYNKHRLVARDDPRAAFTTFNRRTRKVERLTSAQLSSIFYTMSRAVGVWFNWQVTRHTCATRLIARNYNVRYVQEHLRLRSLEYVALYGEAPQHEVVAAHRRLKGLDTFGG